MDHLQVLDNWSLEHLEGDIYCLHVLCSGSHVNLSQLQSAVIDYHILPSTTCTCIIGILRW